MVRAFTMAMMLVGCAANKGAGDEGEGDTAGGGSADGETVELPDGLNGDLVDPRLPVPDFVATNRDGTARGPVDLTGGPTVMWFYPAAGTYG